MIASHNLEHFHPQPGLLLRWLAGTVAVEVIGAEHIPSDRSVLVLHREQRYLLGAAYRRVFGQRTGLRENSAITIPTNEGSRHSIMTRAVLLARANGAVVLPLSFQVTTGIAVPGIDAKIPLPGSRIFAVMEAPFEIPPHPAEVPTAWIQAIDYLIERASGRAADALATWKHQRSVE